MKTALEFIKEKKFLFQPTFDRRLRRFDRFGKVESGWAIGKVIKVPSGDVQHLCFGDFATSERWNWYSRKVATKEDQALIDQAIAADTKAYQEEKNAIQEQARARCSTIWETCKDTPTGHGYLVGKGIREGIGTRTNASGDLVVPMRDVRGVLWNIQRIAPNGTKGFFRGGKILGNFFQIGEITEKGRVYVCEGYATGVSVYAALSTRDSNSILRCGDPFIPRRSSPQSPNAGASPSTRGSGRTGVGTPFEEATKRAKTVSIRDQPPMRELTPENTGWSEQSLEKAKDMVAQHLLSACGPPGATAASGIRCEARGSEHVGDATVSADRHTGGGLGPMDSGQPEAMGHQVQGILPTRRPLAPSPNGGQPKERGPGRGGMGGDLGNDPSERVGQRGAQIHTPGARATGPGEHGAPDPLGRLGQNAHSSGPCLPDAGAEQETSDGDRDRRRRRRALEWHAGEQRTDSPRGLQPEGFSGSSDEGNASGQAEVCVIVAFNTANLTPVVQALRQKYPGLEIVLCADDDVYGEAVDGVAPKNAGREQALKTARAHGCRVVFPRFDLVPGSARLKPTDFNDMACLLGLQAVARGIEESLKLGQDAVIGQPTARHDRELPQLPGLGHTAGDALAATQAAHPDTDPPQPVDSHGFHEGGHLPWSEEGKPTKGAEKGELGVDGDTTLTGTGHVTRFDQRWTKEGKPIKILEREIVEHLLAFYGNRIVKQQKDLFVFTGTYWKHLEPENIDWIKTQIQYAHGGDATSNKLESIYRMLLMYIEPAPREMFTPLPWAANFLNGTLFAVKRGAEYVLEFRPHCREDFAINILPYEYDKDWESKSWETLNPEFAGMLSKVFVNTPDSAERVRAVAQMYGACLMPTFPRLFMLYGPTGTGKSTVIKIGARLVDESNVCDVEPHEFKGFNMETMAGKLVNIDTDISVTEPISDSMIKKIEDRRPVKIHRKGLKDVYAPLPCTHIFGGNAIPRTLEGVSRAHDRRWTFLEFMEVMAKGQYDKDYDRVCFDSGPQGILVFALMGLKDLLVNRGHFVNPSSGMAKMAEWQLRSDPVGQFLEDMKNGEAIDQNSQAKVEKDGQILRSQLWVFFKAWHVENLGSVIRISRNQFYENVRAKGVEDYRSLKGRFFKGISLVPSEDSLH